MGDFDYSRCLECGGTEFLEHRLELARKTQPVNLRRSGQGLEVVDYFSPPQELETVTFHLGGYECSECRSVYSPEGRRLPDVREPPGLYVGGWRVEPPRRGSPPG